MTGSGGASSTPRLLNSGTTVSGILGHPPSRGLCISRAPMILLRRRFAGGTDGGAADRTIELYGRSGERSRARQRTVAADGGTGGLVCGRSAAGRLAQRIEGRAGLSCACAVQGVAVAAMVWIVRSRT